MLSTKTHVDRTGEAGRRAAPYAIILAAAFIATFPLLLAGPSCGHDLTFHLVNWQDAAHQWRTGTLRPWWNFAAAWNTGEARYLFYPPLSWMLGALLTLVTGAANATLAFTFLALAASGFTMRRFLAAYVSPPLAMLGACLYLAHPYMLFTATERTAYAELLAAAWLPWLLQEALRSTPATGTNKGVPHVRILGRGFSTCQAIQPLHLAIPVALLWLTNTPAAVLGTYTLALVLVLRTIAALKRERPVPGPLILPAALGYTLGLALSAWYLLPALVQHNAVEVAQAFTAGMQPEEGTLFHQTGQPFHDAVVHQASVLAVILLAAAALASIMLVIAHRKARRFHNMREASLQHARTAPPVATLLVLTCFTLFLLTKASLWVWRHAPELHFLQFPWRTLMLQGVVTVALVVLAMRGRIRMGWAAAFSLVAVACMSFPAHHAYAQVCDSEDAPASVAARYGSGDGFEPYDEYTPADADNDLLHPGEPPAWTASTADAKPSAAAATRVLVTEYGNANHRVFSVQPAPGDRFLVVRQRRFRNWRVSVDDHTVSTDPLRDDDLFAIPLPDATSHTVTLEYRWSWDQVAGVLLSALTALALLLLAPLAANHIKPPAAASLRRRPLTPPVH